MSNRLELGASEVGAPALAAPKEVVIFSTADWDHPFWTNKQHVAAQLAALGTRVLYVESLGLRSPTLGARDLGRIARRARRAAKPLRQARENLWVFSPIALPWHSRAAVRCVNEWLLGATLGRALRRLGFRTPIAWTYNPLALPIIERLAHSMIVYHAVDDLSAAPHMPAAAIQSAELAIAGAADLIFTTSPRLQSRFVKLKGEGVHYLPNVADYAHFAQAREAGLEPDDVAAIPRPRLGFVGALSAYKVDFELLLTVAKRRPEWHWVLIGQIGEGQPGSRVGELERLPNVHLLGPKPYAELPAYLRAFDVATIPAAANDYTASMFPMKFFEYLSAGKPVVASNTPALEAYQDACRLVDSAAGFESGIDDILLGEGPSKEACDALARRFTWQWRMQEMLEHLGAAEQPAASQTKAPPRRGAA